MEKIQSDNLVCSAAQVQTLLSLGIRPAACFCYEWLQSERDGSSPTDYEYIFGGEYVGQEICIPAWTYEELCMMIGGNIAKPDLLGDSEWTSIQNMMQYAVYLPEKMLKLNRASEAAAAFLIWLIENKHLGVAEINDRISHYISRKIYNPQNTNLEKEVDERLKSQMP